MRRDRRARAASASDGADPSQALDARVRHFDVAGPDGAGGDPGVVGGDGQQLDRVSPPRHPESEGRPPYDVSVDPGENGTGRPGAHQTDQSRHHRRPGRQGVQQTGTVLPPVLRGVLARRHQMLKQSVQVREVLQIRRGRPARPSPPARLQQQRHRTGWVSNLARERCQHRHAAAPPPPGAMWSPGPRRHAAPVAGRDPDRTRPGPPRRATAQPEPARARVGAGDGRTGHGLDVPVLPAQFLLKSQRARRSATRTEWVQRLVACEPVSLRTTRLPDLPFMDTARQSWAATRPAARRSSRLRPRRAALAGSFARAVGWPGAEDARIGSRMNRPARSCRELRTNGQLVATGPGRGLTRRRAAPAGAIPPPARRRTPSARRDRRSLAAPR